MVFSGKAHIGLNRLKLSSFSPQETGIYRIYHERSDGFQMVVYVGVATKNNTIRNRIQNHRGLRGSRCLAEYLRRAPINELWFEYYLCDDSTAATIEAIIIQMDKPLCNSRNDWQNIPKH